MQANAAAVPSSALAMARPPRWSWALSLMVAITCASCSTSDGGPRAVLQSIGGQFLRGSAPLAIPQGSHSPGRKEPFFAAPWRASFELGPDGTLQLKEDLQGQAPRLTLRFPATSAGELWVQVEGATWLKERLAGGSPTARAELVDGRILYAGARRGIDRVYEATPDRLEEYLRVADAQAAAELVYEVETGPGIADLITDGSGLGLVALDAAGKPVLNAPQPVGVDARGQLVRGRLFASRVGEHRFTVRAELLGAPSYPVLVDPSWVSTGTMLTAASYRSATTLNSGRVLVTGGLVGGNPTTAAELYDPATGLWTATGSMSNAFRWLHTATRLADGRVLVTGGVSTPAAEIYDPGTGGWTPTLPMAVLRYEHTATLLSNGRVLVVGGNGTTLAPTTAEIYNPVTGSWAMTAPPIGARGLHTATLLPSGRVLVAGGQTGLGNAELYDPLGATSTATLPMIAGRSRHSAVLLQDGRVLAATGNTLTSAELFDPGTGLWRATGSMALARNYQTATLLPNGDVVIAGGSIPGTTAEVELYRPSLGTWSTGPPMVAARQVHVAALLPDGKILVASGTGVPFGPLSSAERYPIQTLGETCVLAGDCTTGFCADQVCCSTACGAGCDSCNLTGSLGTCTTSPAGSAGSPSCAPYFCSGSAAACPSSCTLDTQCVAGRYCDGASCVPKKADGLGCGASNECVSVNCVDAVCCDTACLGACNACNLSGRCTLTPAGSGGSPSCAPYLCDGAAASCPSSCTLDTQCATGQYCNGSGCAPLEIPGAACSGANACVSGNCVDSVCCETACTGACEACNLAGAKGSCTSVPAGSAGSPSCAPFTCTGTSATCPATCLDDTQCASGQYCEGTGCVPKKPPAAPCTVISACLSGHCVDGVCCDAACNGACGACNVAGKEGKCVFAAPGTQGTPSCTPFICPGDSLQCPSSCVDDHACEAGHVCVAGQCLEAMVADGGSGPRSYTVSCGCWAGPASSGAPPVALWLAFAFFSSRRGGHRCSRNGPQRGCARGN